MRKAVMILAVTLPTLLQCGPRSDTAPELTVESFERNLEKTPDALLLDVRTGPEYNTGHLKGARLMDVQRADFRKKAEQLDKSKPVFVYCATGIRSDKAAVILKELGFEEIYELRGGFNDWAERGKPVVQEKNQ